MNKNKFRYSKYECFYGNMGILWMVWGAFHNLLKAVHTLGLFNLSSQNKTDTYVYFRNVVYRLDNWEIYNYRKVLDEGVQIGCILKLLQFWE